MVRNVTILPPLPRRDDLDPVAVLHRRRAARPSRNELAVERSGDLGLPVFERLQGLRERPGGDLAQFAVDDQGHTSAPARSNASVAARSANAGVSRNPWR